MTRVLVTGAAGFIGSHVVDKLVGTGLDVVAIDNLQGGFKDNINPTAVFEQGDITDKEFIEEIFRSYHFDYVYHLGAYAAEGLSHFIRNYNYTTNLLASVNLINQSVLHGVKRFIFSSSIAVYGDLPTKPYTESMAPNPEDPYGISKYAVELDLKAAFHQFGLEYTIFRPHNVYGPRQNIADQYRNVVGIFIKQCMENRPMTIFGSGKQSRAFSYIDDVALKIAEAPLVPFSYRTLNKVLNVGSGLPTTVEKVAVLVARAFNIEPDIEYLKQRNEVEHAYADHSKITYAYGWDDQLSLSEGIKRTVEWAKKQGIPKPTPFPGKIEVPINMPPSWVHASKISN